MVLMSLIISIVLGLISVGKWGCEEGITLETPSCVASSPTPYRVSLADFTAMTRSCSACQAVVVSEQEQFSSDQGRDQVQFNAGGKQAEPTS